MSLTPLTFGQSADPDDAFMAWALATGKVTIPGYEVRIHFDDIQSLNEMAVAGELEVTALSAGVYPLIADRYRLLRSGASFGREYGPVVVGQSPAPDPPGVGPRAIDGLRVAVPGKHTSAYTLLRIYAGDQFEPIPMRFDAIMTAVVEEAVDAGLIIHEGQLTYQEHGLHLLCEPARAWHERNSLPVPLGVVAVRRDLGEEVCRLAADAFKQSIEAALANPDEAIEFAAEHARGLDEARLRKFVHQYVDSTTLDMGNAGLEALERFYADAAEAGLSEEVPPLDPLE
jgi:1,4-dihydroxy-6-naphthoate synthase